MNRHHEHHRGPRPETGSDRRGRRGDFAPRGRGGRRGGPRGGRARRGDVKTALLALLAERPMHGYEMINELEARTNGAWRPSPGSVYPSLQLLEDESLVTSREQDGKRLFTLTEQGASAAALDPEPWREVAAQAGESPMRARESVGRLTMALKEVMGTGTEEQQARALDVVDDARRKLYGILAEG